MRFPKIKIEKLQHGGKCMTPQITWRGFTLIELLVVVLIIAVLATVAVSAYQRAVVKSRFSSLMPIAKTLAQGNEDYYLRNGQYADDVSKLDIKAVGNDKTQITLSDEDNHKYVLLTRDDMNNNLRMYQQKSKNFPGETHCEALINDSLANWLCRDALKGTFVGNKYGYAAYSLNPETVGTLARVTYNGTGDFSDGDVCVGTTDFSGCTRKNFTNESVCVARGARACNYSVFDHSYCIGDYNSGSNSSCGGYNGSYTTYNNHSVCYALYGAACDGGTRYDSTSCCEGPRCKVEEDTCAYKGITPPPVPNYQNY